MQTANSRMLKKAVKSTQVAALILAFQKSGLGAPALDDEGKFDGTIADNGVGDYTITFSEAFKRTPMALIQTKTADVICRVASISTTAVQITCFDATDGTTAKEADFDLLILGHETADQV